MSIKDYEGGIITKNPTTPTGPYQDGAASGVWTMDQAAEYTKQGVWPTAGNITPEQYVDGVFSTYLYEGNGTSQTITNNLDLAGKGGMVWTKERSPNARNHFIGDSARDNFTNYLYPNLTNSESGVTASGYDITSVSSTGYNLGPPNYTFNNESSSDQVSWSFLKKPGFFDVVTYTGDGTSSRDIAHNLGIKPGFILTKRLNLTGNWTGYHQSLGYTKRIYLDLTNAASTNAATWVQEPTATHFTVGSENTSGSTYVAYLFAHDAQVFGDNQDESIIKCGSFTQGTTASSPTGNVTVNLGFEPQWLLIKNTTSASDWVIYDAMRGVTALVGGASYPTSNRLRPNTDDVENNTGQISINSTGFTAHGGATTASDVEIYIAIRRPMKTPESGTEVFTPTFGTGSGFNFIAGFPVDMAIIKDKDNVVSHYASARLTSGTLLATDSTAAEFTNAPAVFDSQVGYYESSLGSNYIGWLFKRAPGFMDVVATTGASGVLTLNHNLGVPPEFLISKRRNGTSNWYADQVVNYLRLNTDDGNLGTPVFSNFTATTFDADAGTFSSGETYITYLFATLAGISKVGSYTGTAANLDVDCGFTSGARFILIKRTDSTGDWYVYDSVRGIVSGNDPYLLLNSTAAEVTGTDYIDPLSSGFTVTSSAPAGLNASGGSYIFLAIA